MLEVAILLCERSLPEEIYHIRLNNFIKRYPNHSKTAKTHLQTNE